MPGDDEYNGNDLGELEVTVDVTNIDETGMVMISPIQPQIGTLLTPILTDPDNIDPGVGEWQWASASSMTGNFTDIPDQGDQMTYRPTTDDLGMFLRVTVEYVDRAGYVDTDGNPIRDAVRTLEKVTDKPVRRDIVTSNIPPKYPDQSTVTGVATIDRTVTDRFIRETAAAKTLVGAPVTAFDDRTALEDITYSLRDAAASANIDMNSDIENDDSDPNTPPHNDGHARSFDIDAVTGQIKVGARAVLDVDAANATNPYTVVVQAVDPDGDTQDITVVIHLLQDGEPPMITDGPREMTHVELDRNNIPATEIDKDLDTAAVEAATYTATDPEGVNTIIWSLTSTALNEMGEPDSRFFSITPVLETD